MANSGVSENGNGSGNIPWRLGARAHVKAFRCQGNAKMLPFFLFFFFARRKLEGAWIRASPDTGTELSPIQYYYYIGTSYR